MKELVLNEIDFDLGDNLVALDLDDLEHYYLEDDSETPMTEERLNEVIIDDKKIKILFSYPLTDNHYFTFISETGFTRIMIIDLIRSTYQRIFLEEQLTYSGERKNSMGYFCGKYGIWGHSIYDLAIEGMSKNIKENIYQLHIGS